MTEKNRTTSPHNLESPQPARSAWAKVLPYAAIAAAMAFAVCLGVRPLSSPDLGYHLAYGDDFLRTGRIVDCNEYVYTLPPADTPPDKRPEPGPGCWYDEDGKYRFANANWGTQVVVSLVNRAWGTTGLCVLGAALTAGIFTFCLLTMLRLGVPRVLAAGGIILIGLTAYERFMLRPELFGYFLLTAQMCLLIGRRLGIVSSMVLILLQLIFVNMHSYFLLGLMLTGAFFAEAALRRAWPAIRGRQLGETDRRAMNIRLMILGVVLAGQIAVSFVNPWTWRLVTLPFQTVLFVNHNQINGGLPPDLAAGQTLPPDVHP
ncbi:MAG: hypothetical protein EHM48_08810, partial [Planctomycetaceae bacterium]